LYVFGFWFILAVQSLNGLVFSAFNSVPFNFLV
jgi:hypothetical protein